MNVTEIKDLIKLKIDQMNYKEKEINLLKEDITKLKVLLNKKEEDSLMSFVNEGDEYEMDRFIQLGFSVRLIKGDIFKIIKVNKKSLYIQIIKKHEGKYVNGRYTYVELSKDNKIYAEKIKISSSVMNNNFKKVVKDKLETFTKRNDMLNSILE
jgi:hypothetical protein